MYNVSVVHRDGKEYFLSGGFPHQPTKDEILDYYRDDVHSPDVLKVNIRKNGILITQIEWS